MSLLLTSLVMSLLATLWVWMAGRRDPLGKPWLTALCLSLLLVLPLLALLPKVKLQVLEAGIGGGSEGVSWVWMVWLSGIVLMMVRVVRGHIILGEWLKDSVEVKGWDGCLEECAKMLGMQVTPEVRMKPGLSSPVVAGLIRPVIMVPEVAESWGKQTRKMVILHEMGHVQRKDLWLRMAADITCALHWFNPLVWWLRARLLVQCEYACDVCVIEAGADTRNYIKALCDVAEAVVLDPRPHGVTAMADHAPLKMRVARLLSGARGGGSWLAIIAAVIITTTALGLSLVRTVEKDNADKTSVLYEINLRHSADPFPGN